MEMPHQPEVPPEIPVSGRHVPERLATALFDQARAQTVRSGHWRNLSMMGPVASAVAVKSVIIANSMFIRIGMVLSIVPTTIKVERDTSDSEERYSESHITVFRLFIHEVRV